jgi:hypothetical protein
MIPEKGQKNMPEEILGWKSIETGWLCPFFWRKEVTL